MPVPFATHENTAPSEIMGSPIMEWDADSHTTKPLELQFQFYDNLDAAPAGSFDTLTETPWPCKLLNPNLHPWQYSLIATRCYVVSVTHEETGRLGVAWGLYRIKHAGLITSEDYDKWHALSKSDAPVALPHPSLETRDTPPRYYQLLPLHHTQKQAERLANTFYIVNLEHEGAPRLAAVWEFYQGGIPVKAQISPQLNINLKE